uniref:Pectinesterase inhibitor domain-containing protein n=1 Tax=Ananas comosus var. bracteatus TaxID=296719 RepID=A0A6V7NJM4_ANACO|nr:unnamed protein product [Ananas comosus var. bracteatus]
MRWHKSRQWSPSRRRVHPGLVPRHRIPGAVPPDPRRPRGGRRDQPAAAGPRRAGGEPRRRAVGIVCRVGDGRRRRHEPGAGGRGARLRRHAGDAADELRESAEEMDRMKEGGGSSTQEAERFEISNVQTWMSAALTNDDTCVEGFGGDLPSSSSSGGGGGGSSVSELVRSQVVNVAQLTSNALFFINKLASFEP